MVHGTVVHDALEFILDPICDPEMAPEWLLLESCKSITDPVLVQAIYESCSNVLEIVYSRTLCWSFLMAMFILSHIRYMYHCRDKQCELQAQRVDVGSIRVE